MKPQAMNISTVGQNAGITKKDHLGSEPITLYQKFETYIGRNETARPYSQFLHSCVCERFIYSRNRSSADRRTAISFLGTHKSETDSHSLIHHIFSCI
jgi:hypothetical protein